MSPSSSSAAATAAPASLSAAVQRLPRLDTGGHWVVSCYLKLEPRDRTRGKYAIKLKNRIRDTATWLERQELSRSERETVQKDLTRVREYLEQPTNLPVGRGIALFASSPLDLFEAIPLPQVFRSRLAVDRTPLIRELAALEDEFGLILCAVYDRTSARLFKVTAYGAEELPGLVAEDTTRPGKFHSSWSISEHNFNQRIRVEKHRHYAAVARRLFEMSRQAPVRGVVLAGTGAEAGAAQTHLHPYVAKLMLGVARLAPKSATAVQVMDAVLEVRRKAEQQWETEHVRALKEGRGDGWAVDGIEATLGALARGQVRVLLVDPDAEAPGWRCGSGRLTTASDGCEGDQPVVEVPDIIDDAIEEALRQGSHIEVLESRSMRSAVKGLAALLRFR